MTKMMQCLLCEQAISAGQRTHPIGDADGPHEAHWECMVRSVMGGIGHIEDHAVWCVKLGDPDGGRSYRQSAIEVAQWVASRSHQGA